MQTIIVAETRIKDLIEPDLKKLNPKLPIKLHLEINPTADLRDEIDSNYGGLIVSHSERFNSISNELNLTNNQNSFQTKLNLFEFYEKHFQKIPLFFVESDNSKLRQKVEKINYLNSYRKRFLDIILAVGLLTLTAPFFLMIPPLIRLGSRGPIFYQQIRTGKDNKKFQIFKFRSMIIDAEKDGPRWATKNDSRITFIGKIMRKTRIDELPQLWNVLKGEMSLIGPRPERPEFIAMLSKKLPGYHLRHNIKPGLTGWAQIKHPYGSSLNDAKEKLQLELYYLKNGSFWLDLKILFRTVFVVLGARGQ
jgi:exopolysaccharide biosynthesis polyprenyl glycosylphosphotransferase